MDSYVITETNNERKSQNSLDAITLADAATITGSMITI